SIRLPPALPNLPGPARARNLRGRPSPPGAGRPSYVAYPLHRVRSAVVVSTSVAYPDWKHHVVPLPDRRSRRIRRSVLVPLAGESGCFYATRISVVLYAGRAGTFRPIRSLRSLPRDLNSEPARFPLLRLV